MSLDRLSKLARESDVVHLLPLVEAWPGLALLAGIDGGTVAASAAWTELGITPAELRLHGWRHYVVDKDATDAQVETMTGPDGRPAMKFRNSYRSSAGKVTLLEWNATPFLGDDGVTLAVAKVVGQSPGPGGVTEAMIEGVIAEHQHNRWRDEFTGRSSPYLWVARIDKEHLGEVIFSEGGGEQPGHFVGRKLGVDFGATPEFFAAVERLLTPGAEPRLTQFVIAGEDNERFAGERYVNNYSLVYSGGGRPIAVTVTTMEVTGAILAAAGHCRAVNRTCPFRTRT